MASRRRGVPVVTNLGQCTPHGNQNWNPRTFPAVIAEQGGVAYTSPIPRRPAGWVISNNGLGKRSAMSSSPLDSCCGRARLPWPGLIFMALRACRGPGPRRNDAAIGPAGENRDLLLLHTVSGRACSRRRSQPVPALAVSATRRPGTGRSLLGCPASRATARISRL